MRRTSLRSSGPLGLGDMGSPVVRFVNPVSTEGAEAPLWQGARPKE